MTVPPAGWQLLIAVMASVLAVFAASLAGVLAYVARRETSKVTNEIEHLHVVMKSRLGSLVEATRLSAHAAGIAEGMETDRRRANDILRRQSVYVPDASASTQRVTTPH
jgi:hypothetical protein